MIERIRKNRNVLVLKTKTENGEQDSP